MPGRHLTRWCGGAVALSLMATGGASATDYLMTFEGLGNSAFINGFYNNGGGGNFGVSFSANVRAFIDSDVYAVGSGNFANEPSPSTCMWSPANNASYINVAAGFTNFTISYSTVNGPGTWEIYSGLDGTGTLLASGQLAALGSGAGDPTGNFSNWAVIDRSLLPNAHSVKLVAPTGGAFYDNLRIQSICNPTVPPVITSYNANPTVTAGANCTAAMPDLRTSVVATDNCTPTAQLVITQAPAPGTVVGIGATSITLSVRDSDNNTTSVQSTLTVLPGTGGTTYYRDADGDGYGNPNSSVTSCTGQPQGYVTNNGDCNDNDASLNPTTSWYRDTDGDGRGHAPDGVLHQCLQPAGYARINGDNCPSVPNPDQADINGNGFGDACELVRGDLNLDGIVNAADVPLLLNNWGVVNPPLGDLDRNGIVNAADFARMLANWGTGPS